MDFDPTSCYNCYLTQSPNASVPSANPPIQRGVKRSCDAVDTVCAPGIASVFLQNDAGNPPKITLPPSLADDSNVISVPPTAEVCNVHVNTDAKTPRKPDNAGLFSDVGGLRGHMSARRFLQK